MLHTKFSSLSLALAGSACLGLAAGVFAPSIAGAASIINLDDQERQIVVEVNGETKEITLAPKQKLNDVCTQDCVISVAGSSDAVEVAANDDLAIEVGEIYYANEQGDAGDDDAAADADVSADAGSDEEETVEEPAPEDDAQSDTGE